MADIPKSLTFAPLSQKHRSLTISGKMFLSELRQWSHKPRAKRSLLIFAEAPETFAAKFFQRKNFAAIAQLVEHDLAKVGVASSSLVCRSKVDL